MTQTKCPGLERVLSSCERVAAVNFMSSLAVRGRMQKEVSFGCGGTLAIFPLAQVDGEQYKL